MRSTHAERPNLLYCSLVLKPPRVGQNVVCILCLLPGILPFCFVFLCSKMTKESEMTSLIESSLCRHYLVAEDVRSSTTLFKARHKLDISTLSSSSFFFFFFFLDCRQVSSLMVLVNLVVHSRSSLEHQRISASGFNTKSI